MNFHKFITEVVLGFKPMAPNFKSPGSFKDTMAGVVREEVARGIRETSRNQGPGIEKYWPCTSYGIQGYTDRLPYCAAAMCYVVAEAVKRFFTTSPVPFALPTSAGVVNWPVWARKQKDSWRVLDPKLSPVKAGDLVCWDFNGTDEPGGTHIGFALSDERKDGTFASGEGNTNASGSREGDGFYEKNSRTRKAAFAIIRCSL